MSRSCFWCFPKRWILLPFGQTEDKAIFFDTPSGQPTLTVAPQVSFFFWTPPEDSEAVHLGPGSLLFSDP